MLDEKLLGNTVASWLIAAFIALFTFVLLKVVRQLIVRRLGAPVEKPHTPLLGIALEVVGRTRLFFLLIAGLYAGLYALTLSGTQQQLVDTVMVIALLIQGALWVSSALAAWLGSLVQERKEKDASSATSLTALGFVGKVLLWSVTLLLVLENLGVNITALVAGLGVGGIAVALALQNVLGDLFASLSIILDKPFVIGDFVIVDEFLGTVEHIGLKTTRVRSLSGEQVIFSNADLLRSRIRNFKRMYERRVLFTVGVTYSTPYEKLAEISTLLQEIVQSMPNIRFDRAHFKEFGDSGLIFEVVYYVTSPDFNLYMDVQQAINLEIYRQFARKGIDFAFPTRTLYLHAADNDDAVSTRSLAEASRKSGQNRRTP